MYKDDYTKYMYTELQDLIHLHLHTFGKYMCMWINMYMQLNRNKATRSPEISSQHGQKPTPQFPPPPTRILFIFF